MNNYTLLQALKDIKHVVTNDNQLVNTFSVVSDKKELERVKQFIQEDSQGIFTLDVFLNLQKLHNKLTENYSLLEQELEETDLPEKTKVLVTLKSFQSLFYDPIVNNMEDVLNEAITYLEKL